MAIKRSRGEKPKYVKEDAKHWRSLRTEPYEVGDQIGIKVWPQYFTYLEDVMVARGYPDKGGHRTYHFFNEMVALTKAWVEREIEQGRNPFASQRMRYKGCRILDQDFADNINWLRDTMNRQRRLTNEFSKDTNYETVLKYAISHGIGLLYYYNIIVKKHPIKK